MLLYKLEKRFDTKTGKELDEPFLSVDNRNYICDYSGEEVSSDVGRPMYVLNVVYDRSSEEVYYYDEIKEYFEKKFDVDYYSLFDSPFHFSPRNSYSRDESLYLNQEWLDAIDVKGHTFYQCPTMEEAMRRSRVRTVMLLLKENLYTLEQLGLSKP